MISSYPAALAYGYAKIRLVCECNEFRPLLKNLRMSFLIHYVALSSTIFFQHRKDQKLFLSIVALTVIDKSA